jgi:LysR family transcriptional activator of nhaA
VFHYADEIFSIGAELANVVRGGQGSGPSLLNVGVVSSMPKLIAERIVAPAVIDAREQGRPIRVSCDEASLEQLLADLSIHRLDLVLSDQPAPSGLGFKAFNHRLGESGLSFFARNPDATALKKDFPASLNNAPMLLPTKHSALRRHMDEWFEIHGIAPEIIAEFADSALMKAFGETGTGLFAAPTVIENEVRRMYRMSVVGRAPDVKESFYAISTERRLKNDAVVAITQRARDDLFAGDHGLEAVNG